MRGATPGRAGEGDTAKISIHAPREGSDQTYFVASRPAEVFLSTLPVRGATQVSQEKRLGSRISIHAPREGSDASARAILKFLKISIHAPREGSDYG